MIERSRTGFVVYTRRNFLRTTSATAGALALGPLLAALPSAAQAGQSLTPQSTLLVYTNTGGLATGDFRHVATIGIVQGVLATFPSDWLVSGVGATDWDQRIGEVLPGGRAGDLPMWWADPDSTSQAAVVDLRTDPRGATAHFTFLALAIGDPADATTFVMQDEPDIHSRIRDELAAREFDFAGVQIQGDFGSVQSRVAYNFPRTGYNPQAPDYVATDYVHFIDYPAAPWRMYGLYVRKPELQPITAGDQGLHVHGYHTGLMRGGHILGAAARNVNATIWPLSQVVIRYGPPVSAI